MRGAAWFGASLVAVALASPARAATALHTTASTQRAEVGEGIRVEVSALSEGDDSPNSPRLRAPPGFSVEGPSVSSSQQISFTNGHFEHRHGITATWVLVGTRPGRFVIGPATVQVGQNTVQGDTVTVEIVPQGSIQRPPPRRRGLFDPNDPFDPFGMFGRLPGFPDLDDDTREPDLVPEAPPEYQVSQAPEPYAFLRATVTPERAVVGDQVTLRVYAYAGRGPYDEATSSEPSRPDFLSQSIIDTSFKQPRHVVSIDGQRWSVVKLREIALFPLRAGKLTIGSMRLGFRGRGYPESKPGMGLVRQSPELVVDAREPPIAGRPPGYELGDVGTYTLSGDVDPRRVEAGSAVAVTIRIEGTGNVPHHVKVPEQNGVEWLDPTVTEGLSHNDATVTGYRQFRYVVQIQKPGTVELGEVTLPYFDPRSNRYEVARANLGPVEVVAGAGPPPTLAPAGSSAAAPAAAAPRAPRDPFDGLSGVRKTLGPREQRALHWTDRPLFWIFLVFAPGGVAAFRGLLELARVLGRRARERSLSGTTLAKKALDEARAAARGKNAAAAATAIERAVYGVIDDRLGFKARAVLRPDLPGELERRGVPAALAKEIAGILDACDGLRFAGSNDAERQAERAANAVRELSRVRKGAAA